MKIQKRRKGKPNFYKACSRLQVALVLFFIIFFVAGSVAYAGGTSKYSQVSSGAGGTVTGDGQHWINHDDKVYQDIYGENAEIGNEKHGWTESILGFGDLLSILLGQFFGAIACFFNDVLFENAGVDLSIDGIVYGRLNDTANGIRMNLMHFGLEKNNVWGIFGATLYFLLRDRFALIFIPVVGLIMVGKEAFKGGEKGRAGIKEVLNKLILFFVGIYAVPLLLEAYIYIRDVMMVVTGDGLGVILNKIDGSVEPTSGIFDMLREAYEKHDCALPLAIVMLAYAFAGLVYFWDYIKIAMLLAVTFGLFPLILIWWFFKRKIVTDWLNLVLPALLTPFIDMVLLMLPSFVASMFKKTFTLNGPISDANGSFSGGLLLIMVMLACIWTARSVRERVLKLFGFEGLRGGSGAGLGLALAMLARGGLKHFGGGAGNSEGGMDNSRKSEDAANKSAEQMREAGEVMENADKAIQDINSSDYDVTESENGSSVDAWLEKQSSDIDDEQFEGEGMEQAKMGESVSAEELSDVVTEDTAGEFGGEPVDAQTQSVASDVSIDSGDDSSLANENVVNRPELGEPVEGDVGKDGVPSDNIAAARSELPMPSFNENQQECVGKMSDRDKKRFENLCRIDALEAGIANNEMTMTKAGYSRGTYDSAVAKSNELQGKLDSLAVEKADIGNRKTGLEKAYSDGKISAGEYNMQLGSINAEESRHMTKVEAVQAEKGAHDKYISDMKSSYQADTQNARYRQELEARRGVERQYANNSGLGGMNTRTYNNASDFVHQKQVDDIKKRHADYSNFESKQYDGILTPEERSAFYRERATKMHTARKVETVAKVVSVGVGTATAAATAFMGAGTMVTAGAVISGAAQRRVNNIGNSIQDMGPVRKTESNKSGEDGATVSKRNLNTKKRGNVQSHRVVSERTHGSSGSAGKTAQKTKKGDIGDSEMKGRDRAAKKYTDKM